MSRIRMASWESSKSSVCRCSVRAVGTGFIISNIGISRTPIHGFEVKLNFLFGDGTIDFFETDDEGGGEKDDPGDLDPKDKKRDHGENSVNPVKDDHAPAVQ